MGSYIPYGRHQIDQEDIDYVVEVLKSDFITTGPKISEFEKKLADYLGAKYAVAIANGTAALHAACFAAGISEGDEVITTPITFAASANCALYMGAKPVFADVDPRTWNIDPEQIRNKITNKTKAIIPVHFTGQPCDMEQINKIAKEYNLTVIEDAAHALGATYKGKKIGCEGNMTTLSFHPVKHITTGEGGAIVTNDEILYKKLMMFRTHGITRDSELLENNDGPWYYEQQELGYNYRITDIQAALGIKQIDKLDGFISRRKDIVNKYMQAFSKWDALQLPYQIEDVESSWHLYILKLKLDRLSVGRKEIFCELQKKNIGVNVHYIPVYYHPYYRKLGYEKGLCPKAEELYEGIITLPLYPGMTDETVEYVVDSVNEIINRYLK